jgi:hypothetical protein
VARTGSRAASHGHRDAHRIATPFGVSAVRPPDWDWVFPGDERPLGAAERDQGLLKGGNAFVSVPPVPPPAVVRASHARERQARAQRRARRLAAASALAVVVLLTLLLTAFGSGTRAVVGETQPALASRLLPAGPPAAQTIAVVGSLRIQLPIAQSRVTAIGYHGGSAGALALDPVGWHANAGLLRRIARRIVGGTRTGLPYYQLSGGEGAPTSALDIGAASGTAVYSPVDGNVVGITDYVVGGRTYGSRIELRPTSSPSVVVSLTQLRAERHLSVGSAVVAAQTKLGVVLDLARAERQTLARYTQDAGNHVSLQVHPAATLALP